MFCPRCGKEAAGAPQFCPHCGAHLGPVEAPRKPKLSAIAGILDIVSGILGLVTGIGFFIFLILVPLDVDIPYGLIFIPSLLLTAVAGVLAIVGGAYALKRKNWGMALVGAVAAALGMGVLGIAALVLTALSRDEFER